MVAVLVAWHPGPWFGEVLSSVAGQDYPNLSVVVVSVGEDATVEERVNQALPAARVVPVDEGTTFREAANRGVSLVTAAAHVLVCHDDVALEPGAVRAMLEEAYRSNAGLTCPKWVLWGSPDRLLSVGMGADHLGVVHPLVEPGELDQGQHDAVREVFVAPSGAVLVRTDLWTALGGFDEGPAGPGEDLDLSWRAQVAGARVVVAPQAVVRHLEATHNSLRAGPPPSLAEENRLRTLWTCYSWPWLAVVAPLALLFVLAESLWALAHHRPGREVLAPWVALAGSFRRPDELWDARVRVRAMRRVRDLVIWKSQTRGSARVRAAIRARLEKGHELAWAASKARLSWRWATATATAVVVLALIGSRHVLGPSLPVVGQLPSGAAGVGDWWRQWWSGAGFGGTGSVPLSPPSLFLLSVTGTVLGGSASLAIHVLVLGPLVIGPMGVFVAARRSGSGRGRLAATLLYAALPVPYNALAEGHWPGLVAYAAAPWLLSGLCSLAGQPPYPYLSWDQAWPRLLAVGLALAVPASIAPSLLLVVPLIGLTLAAGSWASGNGDGWARFVLASFAVAALAFVALLPWSFDSLRSWSDFMGTPAATSAHLSVGDALRLESGPFGGNVLGWALIVAAATPIVLGRSWRLATGARYWAVALVCMSLAWCGSRGWFTAPDLEVLLAPAGAALVLAVAMGATSVEVDLAGYRFGWRQFAPPVGAVAALAAVLPVASWVAGGQWDLPSSGAEGALAFPAPSQAGDYRVLWVGVTQTLPLAPQGTDGPLTFATSGDGLPSPDQLLASATSARSEAVGRDLAWAETGQTTELGHLLAPLAVRFVVVPTMGGAAQGAVQATIAALGGQIDLVPVGLDPAYQVFENTAWLPVFSVLPQASARSVATLTGGALNPWSEALLLQQAPLQPAEALPPGQSKVVLPGAAGTTLTGRALLGSVEPGSWRARAAGGTVLVGRPFAGVATAWDLPAGTGAVTVVRQGSGGQHVADIVMLVVWAGGLAAARVRRRSGPLTRLARAQLELGPPGAEVVDIDWAPMMDGENVG